MKKVSSGINTNREAFNGCTYGSHAEVSAMKKIKPYKKPNRKKNIDLIVIRASYSGTLGNSKPCSKCLKHLRHLKYYKLKNIYYSDQDGNIVVERFNTLYNSPNQHISSRFRNAKRF